MCNRPSTCPACCPWLPGVQATLRLLSIEIDVLAARRPQAVTHPLPKFKSAAYQDAVRSRSEGCTFDPALLDVAAGEAWDIQRKHGTGVIGVKA